MNQVEIKCELRSLGKGRELESQDLFFSSINSNNEYPFVFVPTNIDWTKFEKNEKEKVKIILSVLLVGTLLNEYKKESNPQFWNRISISRTNWVSLVGGDYSKILKKLEQLKIIGMNNSWCNSATNSRPKEYWLNKEYVNKCERVSITQQTQQKMNRYDRLRFSELLKDTNTEGIPKAHYEKLEQIVWNRVSIDITQKQLDWLEEWKEIDNDGSIKRMRIQDWWLIHNLQRHVNLGCTTGLQSLRFFSPITQGRSILRQFLRGDNQPLYSVDIRCSQPTFVGLLVRDLQKNMSGGLQQYFDLLEKPELDLYEFIGKKLGYTTHDKQTRNIIKSQFFHTLYGPIKDDDKVYNILKESFPAITETMFKLKNGKSIRKKDYGKFAINMQKAESKFILGEVLKRIWQLDPNTFVVTIHDSLLVKQTDIQVVSDIIKECFSERNICPQLHITPA